MADGTIASPAQPVRMSDVARYAGVAIGTVSNVLNQPDKVKPETRRRVQQAIEVLGFVPNQAARSLAAGSSRTIGFVITDLSNSFFVDMARGAEHRAQQHGMNLLLANTDMQRAKQTFYLDLFRQERMAGVLLAPLPDGVADVIRARDRGGPLVVLNDFTESGCSVSVDNELGGYLAARHLIDQGRRRLAFAGDRRTAVPVRDRLRGVERAVLESNGAVSLEIDPTSEIQVGDGRQLGLIFARRPDEQRPDGIVAAADLLALGIMQSILTESELRIPQDIAVTGYDDNRSAWNSLIPITTLAQPGEQVGAEAMSLLLEEIQREPEHVHRHIVLEPELIIRESSRPTS